MQQGQTKYNGLHKRDTYEEIIDYLFNKQQTIRYPNRLARRMRESPYLTQLDGEGMMEIRDQQEEAMKEQEMEHRIRELAKTSKESAQELRAQSQARDGGASASAARTRDPIADGASASASRTRDGEASASASRTRDPIPDQSGFLGNYGSMVGDMALQQKQKRLRVAHQNEQALAVRAGQPDAEVDIGVGDTEADDMPPVTYRVAKAVGEKVLIPVGKSVVWPLTKAGAKAGWWTTKMAVRGAWETTKLTGEMMAALASNEPKRNPIAEIASGFTTVVPKSDVEVYIENAVKEGVTQYINQQAEEARTAKTDAFEQAMEDQVEGEGVGGRRFLNSFGTRWAGLPASSSAEMPKPPAVTVEDINDRIAYIARLHAHHRSFDAHGRPGIVHPRVAKFTTSEPQDPEFA